MLLSVGVSVFNNIVFTEHGDYVVALRWTEPDLNYMYFYIDPEYHDGTECADYIDDYMSFDEIGMYCNFLTHL